MSSFLRVTESRKHQNRLDFTAHQQTFSGNALSTFIQSQKEEAQDLCCPLSHGLDNAHTDTCKPPTPVLQRRIPDSQGMWTRCEQAHYEKSPSTRTLTHEKTSIVFKVCLYTWCSLTSSWSCPQIPRVAPDLSEVSEDPEVIKDTTLDLTEIGKQIQLQVGSEMEFRAHCTVPA